MLFRSRKNKRKTEIIVKICYLCGKTANNTTQSVFVKKVEFILFLCYNTDIKTVRTSTLFFMRFRFVGYLGFTSFHSNRQGGRCAATIYYATSTEQRAVLRAEKFGAAESHFRNAIWLSEQSKRVACTLI